MTTTQLEERREKWADTFGDPPDENVAKWVEENIRFDEPGCVAEFSFEGREYLREPINNEYNLSLNDEVFVMATRSGKTRIFYVRTAWSIINRPCRTLYVKPKTKGIAGAEDDAANRFIPMLRASKVIAKWIPTGASRHRFKTGQQVIRGSIVDWTGSNSVAALASNPCGRVQQDETDKFNTTRKRDESGDIVEADASALADERTKDSPISPKRLKASTPTLIKGLIWQSLLKTDLRRRFLSCPHCGRHHPSSRIFALAWSKDYTVLPSKFPDGREIPVAYVAWDKEARRENGWDLDRVERSARAECPHCGGHIRDENKLEMDKSGLWIPTQIGTPRHCGHHLSAMYAIHRETTFGRLAVKFLKNKNSHAGLRGFINSDLAEPYQNQDRMRATHIMIKTGLQKNREGIVDRTVRMAAADFQKGRKEKGELPHWWHVIADVKRSADARLQIRIVSEGKELTDANLVERFKEHELVPSCVIIDSGFDTEHVYALCMEQGYYCLKAEGDKWFSGHEDGGKKLYAPPKPLHTMIMNHPPKFDYMLANGEWVPNVNEPMFIHVAKYLLMEFFNWMRSAKHVTFEVPGDVSEDFKRHMNAWGIAERVRRGTGEIEQHFKQFDEMDHLYICCTYIALLMLDAGLVEWGIETKPQNENA